MHVGDRSAATIDSGGVLTEYTGVLVGGGYAGCTHLPAVRAWCAAHLLRDLRSISDADPDHQQWALAVAAVLVDAHQAATAARAGGADALDPAVLAAIANRYLGALAQGTDENQGQETELAAKARTLITRFRRYQDMILRFATDLSVPSPTTKPNAPCPRSKSSNVAPAAVGAPWKDSPTSPSCTPTSTPPTNGASTNSTSSANSSPPARGYHQR